MRVNRKVVLLKVKKLNPKKIIIDETGFQTVFMLKALKNTVKKKFKKYFHVLALY